MSARPWSRCVSLFLLAGAWDAWTGARQALAADAAPPRTGPPAVFRVQPNTRSAALASLPPSQVLEFPNGNRLTVAEVRRLAPLAARLRSVTGRGVLRQRMTGPTLQVTRQTALRQLEAAPDATVLVAPDGRKITAGEFKAVLPHLRAPSARGAPNVVGVPRGTSLAELLKHPDGTVLESPSGKLVTVGELRRFAEQLPPGIRR